MDNDDLLFADHIETLMRGFEKNLSAVCSYSLAWEAIGDNVEGETRIKCFNLKLKKKTLWAGAYVVISLLKIPGALLKLVMLNHPVKAVIILSSSS